MSAHELILEKLKRSVLDIRDSEDGTDHNREYFRISVFSELLFDMPIPDDDLENVLDKLINDIEPNMHRETTAHNHVMVLIREFQHRISREKRTVPMPSAIILRLDSWLQSQFASFEGKTKMEQDTQNFVVDTLLGVIRQSEKVPERYRPRFIAGLKRLRNGFGAKNCALDEELCALIEQHS